MILDCGAELPVHTAYLEPRPTVQQGAVSLARLTKCGEDARGTHKDKLRVPLPHTTVEEADLRALYTWHPKELLPALGRGELLALARACHRYAVQDLLRWTR